MSPRIRRTNRWPVLTLATLGGLLISLGAGRSQPESVAAPPDAPVEDDICLVSAPAEDPLGTWIEAARKTYGQVRDYHCTFSKRERINGTMQEDQTAIMKVRTQPFSVHLKFVAPKTIAGREAVYVVGRNGGKMRGKGAGALGLVGFVTLDPTDPRAMQGTRHSITEAGIGNLIERIAAGHARGQERASKAQVNVAEYQFMKRPCVRFEIIDPTADGTTNTYRSVIYFDRETNLPVRYEAYDAPRGGAKDGEMIECFSYVDIRFNLGLGDSAFNY